MVCHIIYSPRPVSVGGVYGTACAFIKQVVYVHTYLNGGGAEAHVDPVSCLPQNSLPCWTLLGSGKVYNLNSVRCYTPQVRRN